MIALIIKLLASFLFAGVATTFLGWIVHWVFHQPWSVWFYHAHMNHHLTQYPPTSFLSEKYRSAGKDNTIILFIVAFSPIILTTLFLMFFGIISLTMGFTVFGSLAIWGLVHDYFHDQFHLINSFWNQFNFFKRWQKLHRVHHLDMRLNFGIVVFSWDKLFKTYDDARHIDSQ